MLPNSIFAVILALILTIVTLFFGVFSSLGYYSFKPTLNLLSSTLQEEEKLNGFFTTTSNLDPSWTIVSSNIRREINTLISYQGCIVLYNRIATPNGLREKVSYICKK
jgi:hypothetical protein